MAKEGAKWRVNTLLLNNFIKKLLGRHSYNFYILQKSGIEMNQKRVVIIRIKKYLHVGHLEGAK